MYYYENKNFYTGIKFLPYVKNTFEVIYMSFKSPYSEVKKSLSAIRNIPVCIRAIKGRKRFIIKECIIDKTYDNIFTVTYKAKTGKYENICFSYADILTGTIKITVYNTQNKNIS